MRGNRGQPFVIAGYTPSARSLDAIMLGYYARGELMYAGRTRSGFTPASPRPAIQAFCSSVRERVPVCQPCASWSRARATSREICRGRSKGRGYRRPAGASISSVIVAWFGPGFNILSYHIANPVQPAMAKGADTPAYSPDESTKATRSHTAAGAIGYTRGPWRLAPWCSG